MTNGIDFKIYKKPKITGVTCTMCKEPTACSWHLGLNVCTTCKRLQSKHRGGKLKHNEDGTKRRTRGGRVGCPKGWKKSKDITYYKV